MPQLFAKRNVMGACLCLLFVGEGNVAPHNGLLTPVGFLVLAFLYLFYFQLLDALVGRYRLSNAGAVLVNFSLYSVLITGLLHGEIADYVLHPEHNLITTLIRVQCSLFPVFVYQFLSRQSVTKSHGSTKVYRAALYFSGYILLLSFSKTFGIQKLHHTFAVAPGYSYMFLALAILSFLVAMKLPAGESAQSKLPKVWLYALLAISLVPLVPAFIAVMLLELVLVGYYLGNRRFRNASV